jgi:predicted DNA-binding transcriptional regulator AlpA
VISPLLTRRDLMALLRISSPTTFARLRRQGQLPREITVTGTRPAWRECDVQQWLAERAEQKEA